MTPLMSAAQLYGAGMTWTFNPHRMLFDKVTDCAQVLEDGRTVPLEDDRLYRVVTGLYSGQMLGAVTDKSFGLLTITPKDEQGVPVTDFEARILHNADGAEVKEWYALASYLQSMGTVDARCASIVAKTVFRGGNGRESGLNVNCNRKNDMLGLVQIVIDSEAAYVHP